MFHRSFTLVSGRFKDVLDRVLLKEFERTCGGSVSSRGVSKGESGSGAGIDEEERIVQSKPSYIVRGL